MTRRASLDNHAGVPASVATVIEAIEIDIIQGRILPKNRLIEDHLMEDYSAKRHVVRAALLELQRLGVVIKPRHLGAQVRRFDEKNLRELYHMRAVLHRSAVSMMTFPIASERLDEAADAMRAHSYAVECGDLIEIHRKNMLFHRILYGLCDNSYLAESIRLHDWLSFPARAYGAANVCALEKACREHAEMVGALATGDRDRLKTLCVTHMRKARQIYADKFLLDRNRR